MLKEKKTKMSKIIKAKNKQRLKLNKDKKH